jgi:putative membrane protein
MDIEASVGLVGEHRNKVAIRPLTEETAWHHFFKHNVVTKKSRHMKQFIWCLSLVAMAGMTACNNSGETDSKELAEDINDHNLKNSSLEDDAEFAVWVADEGLTAVRLGELAAARAENPQVKQLAESIVGDHTRAIEELKALAETKGIVLPVVPGDENQKDYERIASKTGADFEEEYVDYTVREHKKLVNKFQDEANDMNDPEVRSWANEKLPVMQGHLQRAESTKDALKARK